ncbi:hypothetical protein B296_00045365 [Ensete ventricosum]|uniref:WHIM2 domain-containing protein n=1 Tax=Ensete ventricosum TaxID=4639 RepID=A0A426Y135_ENSVE|nr:hypothetical protein B296_00045365 [Ensete ventricosum]
MLCTFSCDREKKDYSYVSAEAAKKLRTGDGCNSEGMKAQRRGKDKDKETPNPEATVDAFLGSLNPKGERERGLKRQLEKYYNRISLALQKRSKDIAQKVLLEENVLRRSTRVRAQPRDGSATAFLRYKNKWKEN